VGTFVLRELSYCYYGNHQGQIHRFVYRSITLLRVGSLFYLIFPRQNSISPGFMLIISLLGCGLCVDHIEADRLCGLVVSVADYKHRCPGFDSRALLRIFLRELGLKRGPLSLVIG
jgi:hypothetical protein